MGSIPTISTITGTQPNFFADAKEVRLSFLFYARRSKYPQNDRKDLVFDLMTKLDSYQFLPAARHGAEQNIGTINGSFKERKQNGFYSPAH